MTDILLLATDLDGTFLGGGQTDRLALYSTLRQSSNIRLAFVTGRAVESVLPLFDDPSIPRPEYVIADVGATVVHGRSLEPVQPLQQEIERRWIGARPVLERLAGVAGLVPQPLPQARRCSFFYEDPSVAVHARERLADLSCDVILSAGRYLDVLPPGVSKGATLLRLVAHLGLDRDRVLVAGDTLNDLSLFDHGFLGVVVGNAEPALIELASRRPRVVVTEGDGAGGILEGAAHHGLFDRTPAPGESRSAA